MVDEALNPTDDMPRSSGATWREVRRPARQASIVADVLAPAAQALMTGVAALLVALAAAALLSLPWLLSPVAGSTAFLISWLWLLADHRHQLWEFETEERQPPPAEVPVIAEGPRTTRLAVTLNRTHQERELAIEPDAFLRLARACADEGASFSERELLLRGLVTGRQQYEQVRDALLSMGWLRWLGDDRRQGVDWTAPGRAGLRALAEGRVEVESILR